MGGSVMGGSTVPCMRAEDPDAIFYVPGPIIVP